MNRVTPLNAATLPVAADDASSELDAALALIELLRWHAETSRYIAGAAEQLRARDLRVEAPRPGEIDPRASAVALNTVYVHVSRAKRTLERIAEGPRG